MTADQSIIDAFHISYYREPETTWANTFWFGVRVYKCPLDLWVYQEIVHETKPDVVIETGTLFGGSALFFACMFDLLGNGRVVTIDLKPRPARPHHNRITYITGSSTSNEVIRCVQDLVGSANKVMVVLDSDHTAPHVLREIRMYSPMVTKDAYLIVEDTSVNGNPVLPDFGPGPKEAVEEFLKENTDFAQDKTREKFGLTFCPGGYLRRIR
jgi:cephalosporin hydroxylase